MTADNATVEPGSLTLTAGLYRAITTAGLPLIELLIQQRTMRGKEEANRVDERRGMPSIERPQGPLVWIHAASIGEAQSVLVLVERILRTSPELSRPVAIKQISALCGAYELRTQNTRLGLYSCRTPRSITKPPSF